MAIRSNIFGCEVIVTGGGSSGVKYSTPIVWIPAGAPAPPPWFFTCLAATHGVGTNKKLDINVFQNDALVDCDVEVTDGGDVTITTWFDFDNGLLCIE